MDSKKLKVAYIIPGYNESHLKQRGYNKVAKLFEESGITPIHIEIDWKHSDTKCFTDYTEQFLKVYKTQRNTETYILGFSYGAMIAFLTATKTKPTALILCSLSPFFEEDLVDLKPAWVRWWKKNFTESDYSFTKIAQKIKTETFLIVGEKEDESCIIRARDAKKKIQDNHLSIAKGAEHKIGQEEYLKMVKNVISKI